MSATQSEVFPTPALEKGWTRSEAPELFKFERHGDEITGVLTAITKIEIESQDQRGRKTTVTQYLFTRQDQTLVKCLATYDLTQKISARMIGCMVRVTYLGEDEKIRRGNNAMKVFDVQYRGTLRDPGEPVPIGDGDIPF